MTSEAQMKLLAGVIRRSILAKSKSKIDKLIESAQSKIDLTLIPVYVDENSSSLLHWGKNDDPSPGTVEQLVSQTYRVANTFKHQSLAIGIANELKSSRMYFNINYVQRTLFISRI